MSKDNDPISLALKNINAFCIDICEKNNPGGFEVVNGEIELKPQTTIFNNTAYAVNMIEIPPEHLEAISRSLRAGLLNTPPERIDAIRRELTTVEGREKWHKKLQEELKEKSRVIRFEEEELRQLRDKLQEKLREKKVEAEKLIQSAPFSISDIRNLDQEHSINEKDLSGDANSQEKAIEAVDSNKSELEAMGIIPEPLD